MGASGEMANVEWRMGAFGDSRLAIAPTVMDCPGAGLLRHLHAGGHCRVGLAGPAVVGAVADGEGLITSKGPAFAGRASRPPGEKGRGQECLCPEGVSAPQGIQGHRGFAIS